MGQQRCTTDMDQRFSTLKIKRLMAMRRNMRCQRGLDSRDQEVQGLDHLISMLDCTGHRRTEVARRDASQLRRHHDELLPVHTDCRHQVLDRLPGRRSTFDQRHDNARTEITKQVRLNIDQVWVRAARLRVLVLVNRKLGHQKLRCPSEKMPCSAIRSLYSAIASAFSRFHCSRRAAATFSLKASSRAAERLTPASRAAFKRSRSILKLVACLGALRLEVRII